MSYHLFNLNFLHLNYAKYLAILSIIIINAHSYSLSNEAPNIVFNQDPNKCMIQNCLQCQPGMPYTCKQCQQGKTCCSPFCNTCYTNEPLVCKQCKQNYQYNQTSRTCKIINQCQQQHCDLCNNQTNQCISCTPYYVMNPYTKTCIQCAIGCFVCNITLDCQQCGRGFYMKENVCQKCDQTCLTCQNSATYCTQCPFRRYLLNNTCQQCMKNCYQCTGPDYCQICQGTYYFDKSHKQCELCGQYCFNCVSVSQCNQCLPGYFLNEANKICYTCQQIIPGCNNCSDSDIKNIMANQINQNQKIILNLKSTVHCQQCQKRYILIKGKCVACPSHCLQCMDQKTCTFCQNGYVVDQNKQCIQCRVQNCLTCKTANQCLYCITGYFWDTISLPNYPYCARCRTGCTRCGKNYCLSCDKGYYLTNNICQKCDSSCTDCTNSSNNCQECMAGYFLVQSVQKCVKCQQNCFKCQNFQYCIQCMTGYRIQSGKCVKCQVTNCSYCSITKNYQINMQYNNSLANKQSQDGQSCLQCIHGYYLKNNQCYKCMVGCSQCISSQTCNFCSKGYYIYLPTSICLACQQNCIDCAIYIQTNAVCQKCIDYYYLNKQYHCLKCSTSNCLQCIENVCTQCEKGYYIGSLNNSVICKNCPDNCTQCIAQSKCVSCVNGFYNKNFTCLKCIEGCSFCNNQNCIICKQGYRLTQHYSCQSCKVSYCSLCSQDINACQQCLQGYTIQKIDKTSNQQNLTSICFKCGQNSLIGCKTCQSSIKCSQCIQGYQVNENNLCSASTYRIWPYILTICLLGFFIILITVLIVKKKIPYNGLSQLFKGSNKSKNSQNYHRLQQLTIN